GGGAAGGHRRLHPAGGGLVHAATPRGPLGDRPALLPAPGRCRADAGGLRPGTAPGGGAGAVARGGAGGGEGGDAARARLPLAAGGSAEQVAGHALRDHDTPRRTALRPPFTGPQRHSIPGSGRGSEQQNPVLPTLAHAFVARCADIVGWIEVHVPSPPGYPNDPWAGWTAVVRITDLVERN